MLQNQFCFLQFFMSSFVTITFPWTKINIAEAYETMVSEFFKRFFFVCDWSPVTYSWWCAGGEVHGETE